MLRGKIFLTPPFFFFLIANMGMGLKLLNTFLQEKNIVLQLEPLGRDLGIEDIG